MAAEAKRHLRAQIKNIVSALSNELVAEQSLKAQNVIMQLEQYQNAQRIGIYLSMPTGEAQTDHMVRDALQRGKHVFVPVMFSQAVADPAKPKRKLMDMLRLNTIEEYVTLQKDSWGIPKLPKDSLGSRDNAMGGKGLSAGPAEEEGKNEQNESHGLDLIVMPGVAFDHGMNRLGHGAGYYDTFLERFCRGKMLPKPFLVALCLAEQVSPVGHELATQEWDWKVDAVASGDGRLLTLRN